MAKTHGMSRTSENQAWRDMLQRCNNPKNSFYKDYGSRGIKVCKEWYKFENFYKDMGNRPQGLTLERIDNNGNYEPSNCKWASHSEQQRNKKLYENNKSGAHGVFITKFKTFQVYLGHKYVGSYKTLKEAVVARNLAELKYWDKI